MGVDTRLFIAPKWGLDDVKSCLESLYGAVEYRHSHTPNMATFSFKADGQDRSMYAHAHSEHGGFFGSVLTLRSNSNGIAVMKAIAGRLGGFLNEADVNESYELFSTLGAGNLDFWVRDAIIKGETDGRDLDKFHERSIAKQKDLMGNRT